VVIADVPPNAVAFGTPAAVKEQAQS